MASIAGIKTIFFTGTLFLCFTNGLRADDSRKELKKDSLRSYSISEVMVTASSIRQVLTQSYSVTILDEQVIENKIASSLIDVLEEVPGITKRGEYHSPIALRGLGGKRLLITKDGNRRMGNFNGGFMGQSVNVYDLARITVIRGPASVSYGPGAITGIIDMQTKTPFSRMGLHGNGFISYGSNNAERNILLNLNHANFDHALSFSSRYRDAEDYTAGMGSKTENSAYKDYDFRLAYTWENDHAFKLSCESELHLGGPWGRPIGFSGSDYIRVYNPNDDTWHSSFTAKWEPGLTLRKLEFSAYYDRDSRQQVRDSYDVGSRRLSYREDIRYRNRYAGWRALSVIDGKRNMQTNIGSDGVWYRIESPTNLTDYFLETRINNRVTKNAGVFIAGVFAESEYKTDNDKIKIRAGLRADYSRINEGEVHDTLQITGRQSGVWSWTATSGIVYNIREQLFLSFQIARSSRMPDASEMFIASSNTDGMIYGNPQLNPEYGLNFDMGFRGNVGPFAFDYSVFCNFLNDFISLEYWTNSGYKGINYTYLNIDKARIYGCELSAGAKWLNLLPRTHLTCNTAFVFTYGDKLTNADGWFDKGVPLRNIPPFNTKQDLSIQHVLSSSRSLYTGIDIRYYAAQNRIAPSGDGGYVSPAYFLLGASAGYQYKRNGLFWDLKLKLDNLFDNKYRPFETLVHGMGRNVKLSLSVKF